MKTNLLLQRLNAGKKVSGVLREANETLTRRYRDVKSGVTVAQQWLKYAAAISMLFTLAIGNAWGANASVTFSNLYSANTVVDEVEIEITSGITATFNKRSGGTASQYYTNGTSVRWYGGGTLVIASSVGNITGVTITYTRTDNAISANVGTWSSPNWSGDAASITFTQGGTNGHLRVSAIAVTYTPGSGPTTYTVTYDGNNKTSGSVPTDSNSPYEENDEVTVLGNTGSLARTGFTFNGWNTAADGSGIHYDADDTFTMGTSNVTLYAEWKSDAAERTFNLVKDISKLSAGQHIVVVALNSSTYYAMSADRGNNRLAVASSASEFAMSNSNETLTTASTTTLEMLTLTSTDAGYFGFQTLDGNYLWAAGASNNYLKTKAYASDLDDDAKWKITLTSGTFAVQADQSSNRYDMRFNYNSNNPTIFSCYATGGSNPTVLIYVEKTCDDLSAINGSIKSASVTGFTLQWDDIANVSSWAVTGIDVTNNNTAVPAGNIGTPTDEGSTYECVVSNLTAGHQYKFTISATAVSGYCNDSEEVTAYTPMITVSPASITGLDYGEGSGPSAAQTFVVTGVGLSGDLTVTAPTDFEVSKTSATTGFGSSVTLTPTSGSISSATIWVRLVSGKSQGSYGPSNVSVAGGSATTVNVSVTGTVSASCADPTINTQPTAATYELNATATALSVTATKNGTGPDLTYQWYSNSSSSTTGASSIGGATSSSYTPSTASSGTIYYYCVVSSGSCSTTSSIVAVTINLPTHKAYFYNGATLLNSGGTSFTEGAAVSYDGSDPTSCDSGTGASTTFVGWATDTWTGKVAKASIVPTFYDISAGESLPNMSTSDVTYYAVFAKVTESSTYFKRVQTLDDLNTASKIAIVNAFSKSNYILTTDLATAQTAPTETDGKITVSSGQYWTLEKSSTNWKFKTGDNYLRADAAPTSSDKKQTVSTGTSGNITWAITDNTYEGNGTPVFTIKNSVNSTTGLEYNGGWCVYYATDFNTSWYTLKLYVPNRDYSNYMTTCVPCTADPTIGDPTIPASFTLTSLTGAVSVNGSVDEGANCSWADMGLVWGATANPTVSNNKKVIDDGTSGHTKSFANNVQPSGSTTPTAWVVGTTYYVRIYGQNNKASATYHYSTNNASFTLRSIDFEENGGSTVNMIYCNSGGMATKPADPTKAGHSFDGWYKESTLENAVDWANDEITANKTYYAKWTPLTAYSVTLEDDGTVLTQAAWGESVILPERAGCEGSTFAGWTKSWVSAQTTWTTTAPTIIPAGEYTPAANENLYPVYTKTEGGGEPTSQTLYFEPFGGSANSTAVQSTNVAATTSMFTNTAATVWSHYSFDAASTTSYATNLDGDAMSNGIKIVKTTNNTTVTMMEVTGINIRNASSLSLSLYNRRTYTSATLNISYKIDGGNYTPVGGTITYNATNDHWKLCDGLTISGTGTSLDLKIELVVSGATNRTMLLDDIKLTGLVSNSTTSYISVPECTIFGPGRTVFIQSGNGVNGSAWNDASCVKAWFNNDGAGGLAQTTYWLFDALAPDAGKKLFATIIPTDVEVNQVTLQRFAPNCTDFWNNNGTLTGSSATSNTFRTECAGNDCVAWNATGVTMNLYGDPNSWASSLAPVMDHGNGVWLATYNNYAPTVTSAEFKIKTNYNGDIGDTGSNNNATLSDMIVGSTYNVTATFNITDHSLVMSKEFVKGTVHFDMQGHGTQIADLTNVTANSKIVAPTAPTATDYLFRGWYKEAACINEWDFANDVVTETMTLYAKWTLDKFTVTWMVSGNTFDITTDVPYGTTTSAPSPAPTTSDCDGTKEFVGWTAAAYEHATTAPNDVFTSTSPAITDNTTFYAVFAMANGTKTYEFEITTEDFNSTSYAANNTEKTSVATATDGTGGQMNVRWMSNQVMKSSGMQWQKDNGYIYNMTNLGTVNSVTITSTDGAYTTYYGATQNPSSGTTPTANYGFFKTKIGGAAGHSSSVVVNFTAPYYIGYSTTCVAPTKCITPMFDPGAGTYSTAQNVSILSTAGATIYYTTDGSTPTTSSSVYSTPISVTADMTIKALAVKAGLDNSDVAEAVYHIRCAMPTFTPAPGTYTNPLSVVDGNGEVPGNGVTISCTTPGVTIHITVDGSEPTTSSPVYEGAIDVPETMVIKAIAVKDGMASSEVAIGKYIIADCDWYESFSSCSGSGGNDGTWSGISGSGGVVSDHSGWTIDNGAYGGNQCVKAGTSSKAGNITTPNIPVTNDIQYKLTFNVAPWDNGTAKFDLVSGAELLDGTTTWTAAANMTALDWNKYEVYIHTTSTEVIIKFYSTGKRFWLNDVCLKGLGNVKYHVTYEGNGSTGGTVPTDATEYANDAEVTVLGNTGSLVKEGYTFAGWNTAADGSGTTYTAGNKFHILHDMTLYAKWTICDYTINWQVNGASWTEGSPATSATYGTQPTSIPTAPTSGNCDGSKVFIGWSATSITGTTSTRPKDLFTSKYAAPFITANTTFYAVFATPTGVPTQFDLYSGALTEGDYLITYNDKSMKAAVTTNRLNYEDVTVTDNKVSNNEPTLVWYLYQDGGYWRIYNTTAGYAAATDVKNQAVIILDGTNDKAKWTATGSATYEFENKARAASSSNPNNKWLRENGTYGFACYATATGGELTLYKRNATYADYATTCTAPVHPYLVAEPTMLDFGNVAVGASVPAQTVTLSGDNLENQTITITAPAGFTVSPTTIPVNGTLSATTITVTPITTTAGTYNGNLVISYPDSHPGESITINIPLILKVSPLYTVTLHDLNTDEGTEQISTLKQTTPGSAVILPTTSPSSVCMINGWVFAGWVEGSALSATSVKPTLKLAEAYVPESDINLYAVYMHRSACTTTTDNIIQSTTGAADNDTYVEWDDIAVTSAARYSGSTAGGNGGIQFRSTDESGIITRTTGGVVSQISIEWNAATVKGRTLQIYGKKTAYGTTSELYDPANRGILLGTLTKGTNITTDVLTIDADFEYIGIRSKDDLAYATTISVVWSNSCTRTWDSNPSCNPCTAKPTVNAATVASYATTTATVNCSGITDITGVGGTSGCVITSYGYCWGISETPNLTDNSYEVGTTYTTVNTAFGEYTITGLTPGVKYCVRPYATNGLGTAYGAAECFTTTLVDHISFEVPNGVDAPQAVTLGEALPYADVPQDCGNCWVFVGWTLESTWDAATLPSPLYKAGYSATSQGLSGTHKMYAVYKRDFYRMLTYPSELALDDGGAQTAFDDNYYVLTLYTGEETGEWAMDAVLDNNNRNATTTNIDNILHLEYGNYSIFNPDPKDVWHLENLSKTGTGEGSSATTKIYNHVEGGQKKYIRLAGSGSQLITTTSTDGNLNLSVTSNNEAGLAASFNIYRQSGRYTYYLARGTANGSYGFQCSTSQPSYSAYVYKRKSLEYKTIPECPKYTVTWKVNGATVRTDYVSRCEGVPKPPAPPAVSPLDECGANGFLGWSTHKVGHLGSEYAPSDVFKDKEDAPELQGNVTFYAIYGYPAGYEYIGDKAVLAHGETYLFLNRKNAGSGKVMNASALSQNNGGTVTAPGVTIQVGTNAIISGEYENYEFYCDQRKVNNSNLRVVSDPTRTKYLFINDRGIGYRANAARSHYTTKNLLYGWNDGQTSVRYAYWNGSAFATSTYNKNVYAFRKIYKNFKTTCYEEWPAVAVEWGQNKLIIDMDTTAAAVAKAAKYDVQIGSLHSSKMDVVQTRTSYNNNASPRTLTIDGSSKFDFTTNAGDVLIVNWYDASNEKIAFSHIYIPSLVASNTTLTEDKDELHVLPGAMLTVNKPHEIGQLEIYPGATVFITGATLTAEKFILRGGWSRVNEAKYDVGRVDIHPSGSLNKSHAFMDWYLDYDLYYPIAVPFPVAIKDIVFKNEQFSPETTRSVIKMKYYDGDQRARTNQSSLGENWKDYSPLPTNLEPSKGYAFTAKRPSGRAFSIIRMPMSFTNAWTTNGEKGVVNGSQKNVVEITKYEYAGTIWKALGWNFVANPYLALYNGNYLTGNLEQQEGGTVRYATIPTIDFQDYYQVDITQADLAPGSGFFVQAGGSAGQIQNIIFASDGRKHMPARILDGTMDDQDAYIRLEHANANDQMGIIVGEDYTEEYEINADLVKMMSPTDNSLKSYIHYNNMDLAYVALNPELAKEWIPVIVRVPESGTYTYTLKESSSVPALEAVWLWDALTGTKTNLLTDDYTFQVMGAGTITGRFSINAIVRPYSIETEIGNLINDDDKYMKFIYQNHIYIRYKGVIYDSTGKVVELPNE